MSLLEICQWLQSTDLAVALRESSYVYPLVEGLHVIGLGASVGTIMWADLRLTGLIMRRAPVSQVIASLRPWYVLGFSLAALTGVLLFIAHAEVCYQSRFLGAHVAFAALALVNALLFQTGMRRNPRWDEMPIPPLRARMAGIADLLLWTVVIVLPRLTSYNLS